MSMDNETILKDFTTTRNLSKGSTYVYRDTIRVYTEYQNKTLYELLKEAEMEEEKGIRWKNRKLKKRLLNFRKYLQEKYYQNTVKTHFSQILTIYKHYEIEIHDLPQTSTKNLKEPTPISFKDLPDKEIIKKALKISNPLMRAIILFEVSSGCAKRETLNITIQDFIDATSEYHNSNNIYDVIQQLKDRDDLIPTFKLRRQKTNKYYTTFCSPEAATEIMNYILSIPKKLKNEDALFKLNTDYFNKLFVEINDKLKLGKKGTYNRFRSHMLRKFHASQLYNDGLSLEEVDALQGRTKNRTHQSYFMEDPKNLKEKYIEHLKCLTINLDVNNLDIKSPEYVKLENEVVEKDKKIRNYESVLSDLDSRLHRLECERDDDFDVDAFNEF